MKMIRRLFPLTLEMPPELRILGLGIRERMRPGIVRRQQSKHFLLVYFHSECVLGEPLRRHAPGRFILWEPGAPHIYGHDQAMWTHSWLALNGTFVRQQAQETKLPLDCSLDGASAGLFDAYLASFFRELSDHSRPDGIILKNLLQNFLRELRRSIDRAPSRVPAPQRYRVLRRFLEEHFDRRISLDELAKRTHASRWHFCREFQRYFGQSPIHYMLHLRMRHAADLLRDPDLNITQIAQQCGYEDVFQFSKLFRKHHGMSPRQLRNSL